MNKFTIISLTVLLVFSAFSIVSADPNGASTVTAESSTRATSSTAANHSAYAGNVTEITVIGNSITQTWQGYFGNVSGAIELADSSGDMMYNWSLANPSGEILASNASSVTWANIECFNWTANGTALESAFGLTSTSVDGVNETFSTGNGHDVFYIAGTEFTEGECMSTQIFNNSGSGYDNVFEEVLLSDGSNTIFTSLLESDLSGFDGATHDFEMIVLEDGHNSDTSTTTYYFYVELE